MKRLFPVICALILGFGLTLAQPLVGAEGMLVFAGVRIIPDPDLMAAASPKGGTIRTSELIDRIVKNPQGQDLGQVKDLVVDRSGRVSFVVISGGESKNGELIPVPFKSVRFGGVEHWLFLSNMDKAKFENAPSIRKDQWKRLEDPAFEKEVFSYYGQQNGRVERVPR